MGGAERAQRRRKQQAMRAVGSARTAQQADSRIKVMVGVVVVAVLAAAVIGGILWQNSRSTPGAVAVKQAGADYPARRDGGVVLAGKDSAGVTIDAYEDFLCPACGSFEARDAAKIEQALAAGTVKVRYHVINLLDDRSNPAGYSLDSAAAGLCAADAGHFPAFHASLYGAQPKEGARGYSLDQLVQLGHDLGITDPAFDGCVRNGTYKDAVRAQLQSASDDTALRRPGPDGGQYFGTPTIVADGKIVDLSNQNWLTDAIGGANG